MLVASLKKEYTEQVKGMADGAGSVMNQEGKFTVVDEYVDVYNPFQVERAMSSYCQPARNALMVDHVALFGFDPSTAPANIRQHNPRRHNGGVYRESETETVRAWRP